MTPNFDEGIDKTHSIGVPGFVGEPIVKLDEWEVLQLEPYDPKVRNWIDCDGTHPVFTCEELGDTEWHRNKSTPKEEPVVDSLEEIDWQKGFIKRIIECSCDHSQHNGEQSCVCDVIDEELSELIALVRAYDARQLREFVDSKMPRNRSFFVGGEILKLAYTWEGK
jgi:hypothetical protein